MRQPIKPRPFLLRDERVRETLIAAIRNLPLDADKPLEVVIREPVKARKLDQNAMLFAGPLKDISDQCWFEGKQYSVAVLHEFLKRTLLPEEYDPEFCLEGYVKWQTAPDDVVTMVGSTTKLTVKGFARYVEQVQSFGASLGVLFTASPNER